MCIFGEVSKRRGCWSRECTLRTPALQGSPQTHDRTNCSQGSQSNKHFFPVSGILVPGEGPRAGRGLASLPGVSQARAFQPMDADGPYPRVTHGRVPVKDPRASAGLKVYRSGLHFAVMDGREDLHVVTSSWPSGLSPRGSSRGKSGLRWTLLGSPVGGPRRVN